MHGFLSFFSRQKTKEVIFMGVLLFAFNSRNQRRLVVCVLFFYLSSLFGSNKDVQREYVLCLCVNNCQFVLLVIYSSILTNVKDDHRKCNT